MEHHSRPKLSSENPLLTKLKATLANVSMEGHEVHWEKPILSYHVKTNGGTPFIYFNYYLNIIVDYRH